MTGGPGAYGRGVSHVELLEELAARLVELARQAGATVSLDQARDMLWEAGAADMAEDLAVARAVIRAADGFHPVARFFAEGSPEHELIRRVLEDGEESPAPPAG